ncbi:hypothetical protein BDF22DRAFT_746485 [Syncephalis plumigaleata]|nr:hypothetical protein BDF22DRAFT_746485 [Syncephalis plumigaleata]
MERQEKTPLLQDYEEPPTVIPIPHDSLSAVDNNNNGSNSNSQASVKSVVPLHQPRPTYAIGNTAGATGYHTNVIGGGGSNSTGRNSAAATPPPPRTNTPRLLRRRDGRNRLNWPSARSIFSCFGVTLLVFFLYLSVTSILHPPPLGPGRRTSIDVGVRHIFDETLGSRRVWDLLAEMTDLYGPRPTGSSALEKYRMDGDYDEKDQLNVTTEEVVADYWQRNEESALLILPTRTPRKMPMLGLGGSVGTSPEGVEAEVIVVDDIDHLTRLDNGTVTAEAEKYGAVAALVRSATPYSLGTPHTGKTANANIPAAAITLEDADYIQRLYDRYQTAENSTSPFKSEFAPPRVRLTMGATLVPKGAKTYNIISEIKGRIHPEQIVVISGHIDSWDVGAGVIDNAAAFFVAWEALRAISTYSIPPRRTIRLVGWADEEKTLSGEKAYHQAHKAEIKNHVFAIESDSGVFQPWGLQVESAEKTRAILQQIGERFLSELGSGNVTTLQDSGISDLNMMIKANVPSASLTSLDPITHESALVTKSTGYFRYHHTEADSVSALDPRELAASAATMATWAYVIAELEERIDLDDRDDL